MELWHARMKRMASSSFPSVPILSQEVDSAMHTTGPSKKSCIRVGTMTSRSQPSGGKTNPVARTVSGK